jgi:hypothetical protein
MLEAYGLAEEYDLPVFPCKPDKKPYTEHGFHDATKNSHQIEEWWHIYSDALIGVPTGSASHILVVDIDPEGASWYAEHAQELDARRVHQTKRGHHLLYRMPALDIRNSAGQIAPGVDVRAEGGYIIWWPAHGMEAVGDLEGLSEPPGWLLERLLKPKLNGNHAPVQPNNGAKQGQGKRNVTLTALAGSMRRAGFSASAILDALHKENYERFDPPLPAAEVNVIASQADKWERGTVAIATPKVEALSEIGVIAVPVLQDILGMEVKIRPWFYDKLLTSGAFLITGRPKVGKSWLLMQLAIAIARGDEFLGFECAGPEHALYIACEDDYARIKMRSQSFGPVPPGVHVLVREQLMELATYYSEKFTFIEFLRTYLEQNPLIRAVFVDTEEACRQLWAHTSENVLAQHSSPTRKDYAEVVEFDKLGLERGVFIGLVNHAAKRKNGQIIDYHEMINRTNTAAAAASGSFVVADPPGADPHDTEARLRVFAVRGRDIPKEHILAIEQPEGKSYFVSRGNFSLHKQTQTETQILEALEGIPVETWVTTRDLSETCGTTKGSVQRCISRMVKAGRTTYKHFFIETRPKKGIRLVSTAA